jgi:hypothetical protein
MLKHLFGSNNERSISNENINCSLSKIVSVVKTVNTSTPPSLKAVNLT